MPKDKVKSGKDNFTGSVGTTMAVTTGKIQRQGPWDLVGAMFQAIENQTKLGQCLIQMTKEAMM